MANSSLGRELWAYMKVRKKWWLAPILIVLFLVGASAGLRPGLGPGTVHLHHLLSRAAVRAAQWVWRDGQGGARAEVQAERRRMALAGTR